MTKKAAIGFVASLLVIVVSHSDLAAAEDRADRNVKIMIEAARKLERPIEELRALGCAACDGRTYLLVIQETVRAAVAVIFGYVDNAEACEEIAEVLSSAPRAGTFKCSPI